MGISDIKIIKRAHFSGHKGALFSLETGIDTQMCYTGGDDGYVVEWNTQHPDTGVLLIQANRPLYAIKLDDMHNTLYCGVASGNLHVIDLSSKKEVRNLEAQLGGIYDIQQTSNHLYTAAGDGTICLWEKQTMQLIKQVKWSDKSARVLAIHPQQSEIAVGFSDHHIIVCSMDLEIKHRFQAHKNSVFALAYHPSGSILLSGGRDAMLRSWLPDFDYTMEVDIPAHTLHINSIAFSPNGNFFATVSMDKTIKLWSSEHMQLLKVIDKERYQAHINSVNKVKWLSSHQFITCSDDKQAMLFEIT